MGTAVCRSYFGTQTQLCANKEINTNPFDEMFNAILSRDDVLENSKTKCLCGSMYFKVVRVRSDTSIDPIHSYDLTKLAILFNYNKRPRMLCIALWPRQTFFF